jgi:hypothetical protein
LKLCAQFLQLFLLFLLFQSFFLFLSFLFLAFLFLLVVVVVLRPSRQSSFSFFVLCRSLVISADTERVRYETFLSLKEILTKLNEFYRYWMSRVTAGQRYLFIQSHGGFAIAFHLFGFQCHCALNMFKNLKKVN